MKRNDRHQQQEKELQSLLEQMPKIQDHQSPDALYENIQAKLEEKDMHKESHRGKQKWYYLPVVASAALVILVVIVSAAYLNHQNMYNQNMNQADDSEQGSVANENQYDMSIEQAPEEEMSDVESAESHNETFDSEGSKDEMMADQVLQSKALQSVPKNHIPFSFMIPDRNKQYSVPISFSVPQEQADLNEYYSNISQFVEAEEWGVDPSIFQGITFDFNLDEHTVSVDIPQGFLRKGGSTVERLLVNSLYHMMQPLNVETIFFTTDGNQGADFAHYGTLTELEVPSQIKNIYKLYQVSDEHPVWIIPIPANSDSSIEEAINAMYEGNENFSIRASIPENITIENIEESKDLLTITFSKSVNLTPTEPTVYMIDAILMTAKSFGYEEVHFRNANIDQIGPYNLEEIIQVPAAINVMPISYR